MKFSPHIFLFGLMTIGCGSSNAKPVQNSPEVREVKVSAENQQSLFPFVEGNTWSFATEVVAESTNRPKQIMSGILEYKVAKVIQDSPTSKRAIIEVSSDGKKQDEQEWSSDEKGIFQISMKSPRVPFLPKQPVVRFPVKDQDTYRWEGTGLTPLGKQGSMRYAYKNDGMQTVDTEMGQMNGMFLQTGGTFKATDGTVGQLIVNAWFSPGVGLVRYKQEIQVKGGKSAITLRLKSYNVKK